LKLNGALANGTTAQVSAQHSAQACILRPAAMAQFVMTAQIYLNSAKWHRIRFWVRGENR